MDVGASCTTTEQPTDAVVMEAEVQREVDDAVIEAFDSDVSAEEPDDTPAAEGPAAAAAATKAAPHGEAASVCSTSVDDGFVALRDCLLEGGDMVAFSSG